jgi:DNA-binding transcriptional regulator YiaG
MHSSMKGAEFCALREGMGLTQEQLAVAMGVRTRTISRWENGSNIPVPAERLLRLIANMSEDK